MELRKLHNKYIFKRDDWTVETKSFHSSIFTHRKFFLVSKMCLTYLTDFVVWIEALKTEIQICWQYCREWNNKNTNLIIKCWKYMILLSYLQWKLVNKIWYSCGKNEPKKWQNWKKKSNKFREPRFDLLFRVHAACMNIPLRGIFFTFHKRFCQY